MSQEPALIMGAVQALIALAVSLGFHLSPEMIGAVVAVAAVVGAIITRSQVTPNANVPQAPVVPKP